MNTRNMLRALALATTCLAPMAAYADDFDVDATPPAAAQAQPGAGGGFSGEVGLGLTDVSGKNPGLAGRYNGLNTNGVSVTLGEFDLRGRPAWDSGDTRYYELTGQNLNVQTGHSFGSGAGSGNSFAGGANNSIGNAGELGFKVGDQGTWGVGAYYDAITYTGNVIDSLYTMNGSVGVLNNNLPAWGGATAGAKGATTAFTVASLQATGAMLPYQVGTRRDILGTDFKYTFGDWTFNGAWRHEHKEGSMEESFGGAYGGTAFAMPIDYDTDRFDAKAAYTTRLFQGSLQYTYSHFADNNLFASLPNPLSNGAIPFQRTSAYSLPPSNDAHYLTMMLGAEVLPKTRVNLNARVGLEIQNNPFAPDTADPVVPAGAGFNAANQGTTANSLDAVATVYQVKASVATHPLPNVDARVYYGLDGRNVSINQYKVNTGSTGGYTADATTAPSYQYVVPQEWLKQNAGIEAGYRILPESDTKVTVGYRFDSVDRSNAQAGHSSQNTANIAVLSQLGANIDGKLTFEYSDRTASLNYLTPWANLAGNASGQTYSGAYYQAPMTSEAVTARADYTPSGNLSGGLFLQFKNENYNYSPTSPVGNATPATTPASAQGIKQDFTLSVGPDVNYRPTKDINLHAFYTYEMLFYNNTGNGACSEPSQIATAACAGSVGYFQNKQTSSTHSAGFNADWQVNDKLKLQADYEFSYGTVAFGEFNGVFVASPTASYQNVANYPDINSVMNNIKLTATYAVAPNIDLVAQGSYTTFHNNDWNDTANAIQGNGTGSISILSAGYAAPNFSIVTAMAGVKVRF